jgi:hypothetical protein
MQTLGVQLTSLTSLRQEPWPLFGGSTELTREGCGFSGEADVQSYFVIQLLMDFGILGGTP